MPSAEFTIKAQKDIEKYGSWDAASIASMVITTESLVADIPEKDCHCGHDNGMGAAGMDGMY